jgi:hypothetical protein
MLQITVDVEQTVSVIETGKEVEYSALEFIELGAI